MQQVQPDKSTQPHEPAEGFMQIGEVAQRTGLTQRALRYWESQGLLAPPSRMDGGFRLYSEQDLDRLERIMELKRLLGSSLAEIKQIMEADDLLRQIRSENKQQPDPRERRAGLERAVAIMEEQIALVRSRIGSMHQLQEHYERRLARLHGRIASIDQSLENESDGETASSKTGRAPLLSGAG